MLLEIFWFCPQWGLSLFLYFSIFIFFCFFVITNFNNTPYYQTKTAKNREAGKLADHTADFIFD